LPTPPDDKVSFLNTSCGERKHFNTRPVEKESHCNSQKAECRFQRCGACHFAFCRVDWDATRTTLYKRCNSTAASRSLSLRGFSVSPLSRSVSASAKAQSRWMALPILVKFANLQMAARSKFSVLCSKLTLFYILFLTWAFVDRCQVMSPLVLRCLINAVFWVKTCIEIGSRMLLSYCCLDLNAKVLIR
jgi:hypothetical protein